MDREKYKSYNRVIASALIDFFERKEKEENDPFLETREREEKFISRIVEAVRIAVEKAMPQFMARKSVYKNDVPDTGTDDINFDFVGN